MNLARDLLDKRVVDRNGRDMGRVDRIVLRVSPGQAPAVSEIEIGPSAIAHRLGRVTGCLADGLECAFGVNEGRPVRLRVSEILDVDNHVRVSVAVGETAAAAIEQRLRRWIGSLPRSS
ncbi:MAG TPA: hypothetical protein VIR54_31435 [Vicinamibacterales bacterium]|jgi:hypothetical protein